MKRKDMLKNQLWFEAWNNFFGRNISLEEVKEGLQFSFFTGDFHLDEVKYEIIESQWDWKIQEYLWICWCEQKDCFEIWDTEAIVQLCKIK